MGGMRLGIEGFRACIWHTGERFPAVNAKEYLKFPRLLGFGHLVDGFIGTNRLSTVMASTARGLGHSPGSTNYWGKTGSFFQISLGGNPKDKYKISKLA